MFEVHVLADWTPGYWKRSIADCQLPIVVRHVARSSRDAAYTQVNAE